MALLIREFGHLLRAQPVAVGDEKAISITAGDFDFLESQLFSASSESDSRFFLQPSMYRGRRSLQVQNHVGVLQTPSGTQIEILPKIYSGHGQELDHPQVRAILIRMLGYLRNSPFRESEKALLADVSLPLIEVFVSYFLKQVNTLVKRGIRSDYVATRDNLGFMKGKLLIADQIRHNLVHQHRFYVEYDEFQVNRPENRLIRSALAKVSSFIVRSRNQRLCRELLFAFDSVPGSHDVRYDLGRCSKDRSMGYYQHVLDWCRIILLDQSPMGSSGDTRSISLLFPMERIFEDYVAARLRSLYPDWRIKTQAKDHYLLQQQGKKHFLMKPDLVLERGKERIIADTKWKLLGEDSSKPVHASIGQADLYQMFAYGKKYLDDQEEKRVVLIYPRSEKFTKPLPTFHYEDNFTLSVIPFDLMTDTCVVV